MTCAVVSEATHRIMARRSGPAFFKHWIYLLTILLFVLITTFRLYPMQYVLSTAPEPHDLHNIVINKKDAVNYLATYGYVAPASKSSSLSVAELGEALRIFQRMSGLAVTGKLDYSTLQRMSQPRCGVKDDNIIKAAQKLTIAALNISSTVVPQLRFSTFSRWPKSQLTWQIASFSTHMSKHTQQTELQRAFDLWARAANLRIAYAPKQQPGSKVSNADSSDVDLKVSFLRGDHGDNEPFDGPGGALGHAFFPRFGGATHFDDAEAWSANSTSGVNLYQVAAHEFGHALGLGHSDVQDAIMAPFYKPYSTHFELHPDDVEAIRQLYAADTGGGALDSLVTPDLHVTFDPPLQTTATTTARPEITTDMTTMVNSDQFVIVGGGNSGSGKDITKLWESSLTAPSQLPPTLSPHADDTLNNIEININDIEPTPSVDVKPLRPLTPKFSAPSVNTADDAVTAVNGSFTTAAINATVRPTAVNTTILSPIPRLPPGIVSPRTTVGFGTSYGSSSPSASFHQQHDAEGYVPAPSAQHLAQFSPYDGGGFGYGGGGGYGAGGGIYGGGGGILHGGYDQFAFPFPTYQTTTTTRRPTTTTYGSAFPAFNPFFFGHGYGGGGYGGGGHGHFTTTPRPEHKYVKKTECNFRDVDCIINKAYSQFQEAQATFFGGFYTTTEKPPESTTRAPETVCDFTQIDAISSDEWGGFWVFSGRRYAYLNINFVQLRFGFTTELASQLSGGVTGAYYKHKYVFLFDNNNNRPEYYYKFDATDYKHLVLQNGYPRDHSEGYPGLAGRDNKVNAVLERHDLTLLMFTAGRMYKYNPFEQPPVDTNRYPVLLKDISLNFPTAITAALFHLHYGSFIFTAGGVYPVTSYGDLALRYPQRPAIPLDQFFRCNHHGYGFGGHVRSDRSNG